METEKILSEIKQKIGETSFSDLTINKYIELNPVAEGAEPDDAYFEKAVGFLKGLQGQYNHDVATKVDDFKKSYKPTPNGGGNATEPQPNKEDNSELKEMKAMLEKLQKQITEKDDKAAQREMLDAVKTKMRSQNADDSYVLEKTLQGVVFDLNKSADTIAEDMLKRYDAEYKACRGNGAAPRGGNGSNGGNSDKEAAKRYFERKARKEGWSKN